MAGIPSIIASNNFYTGLGFAIEPKTKDEYFKTLETVHNIKPLTLEEQKRVRAAYIYKKKIASKTVIFFAAIGKE